MRRIVASVVQTWVNEVSDELLAASVVKYHTFLHSIFKRAVNDRVVAYNPCDATRLPKVVRKPKRAVTPEEFDALLAAAPIRFQTGARRDRDAVQPGAGHFPWLDDLAWFTRKLPACLG